MSEYNRRMPSNAKAQTVPGTPMQQMWHVLNFHEHRLIQLTNVIQQRQQQEGNVELASVLEQLEHLKSRIDTLEKNKKKSQANNVTISRANYLPGFNLISTRY